jgi:hypothetical protein
MSDPSLFKWPLPACHPDILMAKDGEARARPRNEAIEVLAAFSPVAAGIGGTSLPDEVYVAAERVLRWWP